jgi:hypothetical protein
VYKEFAQTYGLDISDAPFITFIPDEAIKICGAAVSGQSSRYLLHSSLRCQLKLRLDEENHSRSIAFKTAQYNAFQRGVGSDISRLKEDPVRAEEYLLYQQTKADECVTCLQMFFTHLTIVQFLKRTLSLNAADSSALLSYALLVLVFLICGCTGYVLFLLVLLDPW